MAGWEKAWWEEELKACEDAAGRGDTGGVYKSLRTLGGRGVKKKGGKNAMNIYVC